MKIAIISDTHDNLENMKKAVQWLNSQGIKEMIHCGDIASKETITELSKLFQGNIYAVLGNMDRDYLTQEEVEGLGLKNFKISAPSAGSGSSRGEVELSGHKFGFTHFPEDAKKTLRQAQGGSFKIMFYGHTHKPWEENYEGTKLVNPGNLAGLLHKATFAVYDIENDRLELKILERL